MAPSATFSRLTSLLAVLFSLSLPLVIRAQESSDKTVAQPQATASPAKAAVKNKPTSAAAKATA